MEDQEDQVIYNDYTGSANAAEADKDYVQQVQSSIDSKSSKSDVDGEGENKQEVQQEDMVDVN